MKAIYFASFYFHVFNSIHEIRENKNLAKISTYTVHDKIVFFAKLARPKKIKRVSKVGAWMDVRYLLKEFFLSFPWWPQNVKSRSKTALISHERHFEIRFPKTKTTTFLRRKSSKLHKKDKILHGKMTFSLKQMETRAYSGPISDPLMSSVYSTVF